MIDGMNSDGTINECENFQELDQNDELVIELKKECKEF